MNILWVLPTANEDDPLGWATMISATDNEDDSLEMNILQYWPADYDYVSILIFKKVFVLCVPACQYVQHMPVVRKKARRGS